MAHVRTMTVTLTVLSGVPLLPVGSSGSADVPAPERRPVAAVANPATAAGTTNAPSVRFVAPLYTPQSSIGILGSDTAP